MECPYTKRLLDDYIDAYPEIGIDNAEEKKNLINSIRPLICGNPAERMVCCDVDNNDASKFSGKHIHSLFLVPVK